MSTDTSIVPSNLAEMTPANLTKGTNNFSANAQLNLKSMGKAITSHFSRIVLAKPLESDASSSSDSDSDDVAFNPSLQFNGLKVGTSTDMNSDSEDADDSYDEVIQHDDMSNTNSTADHSPCKKLSRRKAATLNIPLPSSRPLPTKEQLEARRVSIECLSIATPQPMDVSDSIIERELSLFEQPSNGPCIGYYSMPRQKELEDDLLLEPKIRASDLLPNLNVVQPTNSCFPLKRSFFQLVADTNSSDESSYHNHDHGKRQKVSPELICDEITSQGVFLEKDDVTLTVHSQATYMQTPEPQPSPEVESAPKATPLKRVQKAAKKLSTATQRTVLMSKKQSKIEQKEVTKTKSQKSSKAPRKPSKQQKEPEQPAAGSATCTICGKVMKSNAALGGHTSKAHPNQSSAFRHKIQRREEREFDRQLLKGAKTLYKLVTGGKDPAQNRAKIAFYKARILKELGSRDGKTDKEIEDAVLIMVKKFDDDIQNKK